jgi:heptosyltransferase-1
MTARDQQPESPPEASRILIIRPSALGDVSRTVPALATLRKAHPDAHIDWLIQDPFMDVIEAHPALDGVIRFPRKRFGSALYKPQAAGELIQWLRGLKKARYDLVVDLQGLLRSGIFTGFTGAAKRLGFANAREGAALAGRYTHRYEVDGNLHTVDRMLALLAADGYTLVHDMQLYVPEKLQQWSRQLIGPEIQYACLAPTARWPCKCWPTEKWIELATRMRQENLWQHIVLIAGPSEQSLVQPLLDALHKDDSDDAIVICPQTNVGQMMALLQRSSVLVSNDSAPLHIAVGLGRPVVGIFGPTDPALVGPYQQDDAVVQPEGIQPEDMTQYRKQRDDQSLIGRISVDQVWETLQRQLQI